MYFLAHGYSDEPENTDNKNIMIYTLFLEKKLTKSDYGL